jgi:hypothetical protein
VAENPQIKAAGQLAQESLRDSIHGIVQQDNELVK